jgi:CheY-like chemotaxis protein
MQLTRCTHDRFRDVDESLRQRVADRLRSVGAKSHMITLVTAGGSLESEEAGLILGESLPGAILMDSEMSGTSPFAVVRTLTTDTRYAHIPIIMLVSQGKDADGATALQQGARSFVVRPINLMSLEALLYEVLP